MTKKYILILLAVCFILLSACKNSSSELQESPKQAPTTPADITTIQLNDNHILVNGKSISTNTDSSVYQANDIVFYLAGQDFTYGEGSEEDAHSQDEADKQTVVHIAKPGTYSVSGKLSAGQIAIDLGEDAKDDPNAVVNLILDNVDINCQVAPGIIFYNVFECGNKDENTATFDVDTAAAGANIILADDSTNVVNGSHVAKIYKSVTLNDEGTEVVDSKKLHKYDAAVYSEMSMNVCGEEKGTGELTINADNEGLDSELHLTINSGNIIINSGNDGINTNEDGISVTTINDGCLTINVTGTTGEGDGIDSNGWLVINGGTVNSFACGTSMDSGIDSDMGIYINGGTVIASGNMLDRIANEATTYSVFSFIKKVPANTTLTLKDETGNPVMEITSVNEFSNLLIANPQILPGTYTLWNGDVQYACLKDSKDGNHGHLPGKVDFPEELPHNDEFDVMPPEGEPQRKLPIDKDALEKMQPKDDARVTAPAEEDYPMDRPMFGRDERPDDFDMPDDKMNMLAVATAPEFVITEGVNYFSYIEAIN